MSSKLWCQGSFTLLRCFVLFVCLLHLSFCQYDAFVCQNFIIHSWWSVKFLRGSWGVSSLHVTHFLMFVWCICLFAKILYHFPGGQVRWCVSSLSATHCCVCLFLHMFFCLFYSFVCLCANTLYHIPGGQDFCWSVSWWVSTLSATQASFPHCQPLVSRLPPTPCVTSPLKSANQGSTFLQHIIKI